MRRLSPSEYADLFEIGAADVWAAVAAGALPSQPMLVQVGGMREVLPAIEIDRTWSVECQITADCARLTSVAEIGGAT